MRIGLNAYAKINPSFKIIGKQDGLHLVDGEIELIDMCSLLMFEIEQTNDIQSRVTIIEEGEEKTYYPIIKMVDLWSKIRHIAVSVRLEITNPLPLMAGLGSMSSYATGTLKALENAYEELEFHDIPIPLSTYDKFALAKEIGMDVVFFVSGIKRAHISRYGEIISPLRVHKKTKIILHYPDYKNSTKEEYKALDEENVKTFIELKKNRLYYDILSKKTGCDEWRLSGSGSTFFIYNPTKEILDKVKIWQENKINCTVTTTLK